MLVRGEYVIGSILYLQALLEEEGEEESHDQSNDQEEMQVTWEHGEWQSQHVTMKL